MVRALTAIGAQPEVVDRVPAGRVPNRLVLPGVGRFGEVMKALRKRGFDTLVADHVASDRPFLGVCVGLQVLFGGSDEDPSVPGLGLIDGRVVRFRAPKVPQVGFNQVEPGTEGLLSTGYFYFVNSYHCVPDDDSVVAAVSDYYGNFTAAVSLGSILAVQFHPEKSGPAGLALLRRWLAC